MGAVLLCLATKKGLDVLEAIAAAGGPRNYCICTFDESDVAERYDQRIVATAASAGYPTIAWAEFRRDPTGYLSRERVETMIMVGWRYLVPAQAVDYLRGELYILHDSLLPKLRGFAPLVTAMIAGDTEAGATLLRVGRGVDDGPILWQGRVPIKARDKIADLIDRVSPLYVEAVLRYLRNELTEARPQDETAATYSIWRDQDDYRLNWTQDAECIERTVRALGPPYPGACTTLDGGFPIRIYDAEVTEDRTYVIRNAGKIAQLDGQGRPTVVCGRGQLKILSATYDGHSVLPISKLKQRFT